MQKPSDIYFHLYQNVTWLAMVCASIRSISSKNLSITGVFMSDLLMAPIDWCLTHNPDRYVYNITWLTTFGATFFSLLRNVFSLASWILLPGALDKYSYTSSLFEWTMYFINDLLIKLLDNDIYLAYLITYKSWHCQYLHIMNWIPQHLQYSCMHSMPIYFAVADIPHLELQVLY